MSICGGAFRVIGGPDAGLYYRRSDHLGSTSVISDANGIKGQGSEVVFAPFGEIRLGTLSELADYGFTGQRLDRSTDGLMFYQSRYYLPDLRRFISPDTTTSGSDSQAFNRYTYVRNNPIRFTDPSGHVICTADMDPVECTNGGTKKDWASTKYSSGKQGRETKRYYNCRGGNKSLTACANDLRYDFGVTVTFADKRSSKEMFQALESVYSVLTDFGTQLTALAGEKATETNVDRNFKEAFGDHTITIREGEYRKGTDKEGNPDTKGPCLGTHQGGCYFGYNDGSKNIEIVGQLLRTDLPVNGKNHSFEQILAHELGHTLAWNGPTYAGYIAANPLEVDGVTDTANHLLGIGITAYSQQTDAEYSADVAGAWGLGLVESWRQEHVNGYVQALIG